MATVLPKPTAKKAPAPVEVKREKVEREPVMMVATGMKGVGKTYQTCREIENYQLDKGYRKGRKVLVFDVNAPMERSYEKYKTVDYRQVHLLQRVEARRIVPVHEDRSPFTIDDKREVLTHLLNSYKCGMLVLEDINNYVLGAKSVEIIGAITTNRHKDLDLIIHLQSLSALDPRMWQNCSIIRFHHQLDNIDRYQSRIPNYELMKLAQLIVDEQYHRGNTRYFIYVKNLDNKIIGTNAYWFNKACSQYLSVKKGILTELMRETDDQGNRLFKTTIDAVKAFSERRRHYIEKP